MRKFAEGRGVEKVVADRTDVKTHGVGDVIGVSLKTQGLAFGDVKGLAQTEIYAEIAGGRADYFACRE